MSRKVHYATNPPGTTGRARAVCGTWTDRFTADPEQVTCARCRESRTKSASRPMTKLPAIALFLAFAAACEATSTGPVDEASTTSLGTLIIDTDGASETGQLPTGDETGLSDETGTTSVDADSTSGEDSSSAGSESSTGSECVVQPCERGTCHAAEQCRPHPTTGVPTCVQPCTVDMTCSAIACEMAVQGICLMDESGVAGCFPA